MAVQCSMILWSVTVSYLTGRDSFTVTGIAFRGSCPPEKTAPMKSAPKIFNPSPMYRL